jgi:hypothetical protein
VSVFVPAGESIEAHIADAKKREKMTNRSRNANEIRAAPLAEQIQNLQKRKQSGGLMASKHAPSTGSSESDRSQDTPRPLRRRVPKPPTQATPASGTKTKSQTPPAAAKTPHEGASGGKKA